MNRHFAAVAAVTLALALLYSFDPALTALFPSCPLRLITGLLCPFCGTLRAGHALLHGHLAAAFHYNALTVGGGAVFVAAAAVNRASGPLGARLIAGLKSRLAIRVIGLAAVAFAVARNTPASILP